MSLATVTSRGNVLIPEHLRERFGIKHGDKIAMRPTKHGILLVRVETLMDRFGKYPGIGRRIAIELLEEKRAELAREERETRRRRP